MPEYFIGDFDPNDVDSIERWFKKAEQHDKCGNPPAPAQVATVIAALIKLARR